MKVLRSTLIHPKNGATGALHELLDELDGYLAKQPGFVESYELETTGSLGRVSIWESREDADHAATQPTPSRCGPASTGSASPISASRSSR